ncbi:MAG: hypothetical protein C0467_06070 [Planctomycetaceae bacterium]|nr:hypothetical protein [Planctomycetaceae bacterium]
MRDAGGDLNTLFDDTPVVDPAALSAIAAKAVSREALVADGFVNLLKSTDLFRHGYSVSHWIKPAVPGSHLLEYVPRASKLPRLTATTYAEQVAIHEALGIRVVSPGRKFSM